MSFLPEWTLLRRSRKCRGRTWTCVLPVRLFMTCLPSIQDSVRSPWVWKYRKGGPLAVTDANLLLGRLVPDYFPKIFGKSEKEPLDVQASKVAFEKVAEEINESIAQGGERKLDLDEIVYGLVLLPS